MPRNEALIACIKEEMLMARRISTQGLNGVGYFARKHSSCKPKSQSEDLEYFNIGIQDGLLICRCAKCDETLEEPLL